MPLKHGAPLRHLPSSLVVLFQRVPVHPRFHYCSFFIIAQLWNEEQWTLPNRKVWVFILVLFSSESYFLRRSWNIMEMMTKNICFKTYYATFLAIDLKINCLLRKNVGHAPISQQNAGVGSSALCLSWKGKVQGDWLREKSLAGWACHSGKAKKSFSVVLKGGAAIF